MAGTFLDMYTRITTELRRSNATASVKDAINDAISEAASTRFYFNEMTYTFATVIGQEYYPDQGFTGVDAIWVPYGGSYYKLDLTNSDDFDRLREYNSQTSSQLQAVAHYGSSFRLYPLPDSVYNFNVVGVGKLLPFPLVNDADTNAWLTEGELYIRALAKRNYYRDVVRDYGEARVYDTVAEDYKSVLEERTAIKSSTGVIKGTQF